MLLFLNTLVLVTPFAWAAAWWLVVTAIVRERRKWRNEVSLVSLGTATVAGLLWVPAGLYTTRDPVAGALRSVDEWTIAAVIICGLALILCFFGKAKLIVPIALTCLGTASFWIRTIIS